jgi:hypothetical protein
VNPQPIDVDHESYLLSLSVDPEQVIVLVHSLDGAGLYKITDDHYVLIQCTACSHKGKPLLERVLPREWSCFYGAANPDEGFEVFHYGPEA